MQVVPPTVTVGEGRKLAPVIVIVLPPARIPPDGLIELTIGNVAVEVQVAAKPAAFVLVSEVNFTNIVPVKAVSEAGIVVPE